MAKVQVTSSASPTCWIALLNCSFNSNQLGWKHDADTACANLPGEWLTPLLHKSSQDWWLRPSVASHPHFRSAGHGCLFSRTHPPILTSLAVARHSVEDAILACSEGTAELMTILSPKLLKTMLAYLRSASHLLGIGRSIFIFMKWLELFKDLVGHLARQVMEVGSDGVVIEWFCWKPRRSECDLFCRRSLCNLAQVTSYLELYLTLNE